MGNVNKKEGQVLVLKKTRDLQVTCASSAQGCFAYWSTPHAVYRIHRDPCFQVHKFTLLSIFKSLLLQ